MRYKIYPLIKKNKFNCVLVVKYRYRIQEPEKLTNKYKCQCLYRTKKSTNILVVSVLGGPTRWNTPQSVQTC